MKKHLVGELANPGITDKQAGEQHPVLLLDWKNELARKINRKSEDVLVLKIVAERIIKTASGDFTEQKLIGLME